MSQHLTTQPCGPPPWAHGILPPLGRAQSAPSASQHHADATQHEDGPTSPGTPGAVMPRAGRRCREPLSLLPMTPLIWEIQREGFLKPGGLMRDESAHTCMCLKQGGEGRAEESRVAHRAGPSPSERRTHAGHGVRLQVSRVHQDEAEIFKFKLFILELRF